MRQFSSLMANEKATSEAQRQRIARHEDGGR